MACQLGFVTSAFDWCVHIHTYVHVCIVVNVRIVFYCILKLWPRLKTCLVSTPTLHQASDDNSVIPAKLPQDSPLSVQESASCVCELGCWYGLLMQRSANIDKCQCVEFPLVITHTHSSLSLPGGQHRDEPTQQ